MTTVAKLREQTRIARESGTYVVLTAEEAQSVLNELDALVHDVERLTATNAELATDAENLRGVVRAADAMALECRRVGLISSTWLEDYDDARAAWKGEGQ